MSYVNESNKIRSSIPSQSYIPTVGLNTNRIIRNSLTNMQGVNVIEITHKNNINLNTHQNPIYQKMKSTRGSTHGLSSSQRQTPQSPVLNLSIPLRIQNQQFRQAINTNRPKQQTFIIQTQPYTERQSKSKLDEAKEVKQFRNKEKEEQKQIPSTSSMSKTNFQILCPVGKGGFGKVWKVMMKKTKQIYAMKEMFKAKIINKKSINSVMNQRMLLAKVRHPFLINMSYAFQDRENIYLLMDYINGGDLRYHMGKRRNFSQNQVKFFLANIIVGLEYLHANKIIHRDIKPENLVIGEDGYIRITDLGISREYRPQNYQDTSGTPGYMAPEVICRRNHSFQADFFALGVIGYEMIIGRRPYLGKSRKQIRQSILSKQAGIKSDQLPSSWSSEAADFVNKLLTRNPSNRLGSNGIEQLKGHGWLKDIQWNRMLKKQLKAPFVPKTIEEDYDEYKKQISEDTIPEDLEQNLLMLRDINVQSLFEGYSFNGKQAMRFKRTSTNELDSRQIKRQ